MENGDILNALLDQQRAMIDRQDLQEKNLCEKIDDRFDRVENDQRRIFDSLDKVRVQIAKVETKQDEHGKIHRLLSKKTLGIAAGTGSGAGLIIWAAIEIIKALHH